MRRKRSAAWRWPAVPAHVWPRLEPPPADYNEAIRLDPKYAWAHYGRAITQILMRSELAPGSFQEVIEVEEASGSQTVYAVICGNLSARLLGDAERAQKFLMDSAQKLKPDWPAPCVTFLKGELDEAGLLALATDTDKPTEARCFLGLDHLVHRRTEEARTHFQWIRDQGTTNFIEYAIALAELKRLNAAEQ